MSLTDRNLFLIANLRVLFDDLFLEIGAPEKDPTCKFGFAAVLPTIVKELERFIFVEYLLL